MDFDFPPPYNVEVPRCIEEARRVLSDEGVKVLEMMITESGSADAVVAAMEVLPQHEIGILVATAKLIQDAYDARIQENQGWADLHRQKMAIFRRAGELEPEFATRVRRDEATIEEAVDILKCHGEPVGISDEVFHIMIEMPPEE